MKNAVFIISLGIICLVNLSSNAQSANEKRAKIPVYGEYGLGFGQALFFGDMKQQLANSYGGSFNPSIGNNLT